MTNLVSLEFGVHKSLRYHAKRRSFFEALHMTSTAVSAVAGSAAFVSLLTHLTTKSTAPTIALVASALIAVVTTLDLVIGYSQNARQHDALYQRFALLAADIVRKVDPDDEQIRQWSETRLLIEKDEPTTIDALNVICHNHEAEARGYGDDDIYRVRWYQRVFAQFFTLPPNRFPSLASLKTTASNTRNLSAGPS